MWKFLKWFFVLPEPSDQDTELPWIFGDGSIAEDEADED